MGLDSYFGIRQDNGEIESVKVVFEGRTPSLCGGMFSGDGCDGSFRGKVYDDYVTVVTGVSLYQVEIDNTTVRQMAAALRAKADLMGEKYIEAHDLALVFEKFGEAGCSLYGWW